MSKDCEGENKLKKEDIFRKFLPQRLLIISISVEESQDGARSYETTRKDLVFLNFFPNHRNIGCIVHFLFTS